MNFVFRNGQRLTPYMYYQIERLNADVKKLFGVEIIVSSGIRLPQEQIDVFLQRYVTAANIRGRKVYDTRVWRGVRYYRISAAGTVAVPGTSNHEVQGSRGAVDIRDTGSDAGVTNKNSTRGRWIRANAWRYGLVASGDGFNEGWHFDMLAIFTAVPAGGGSNPFPNPDQQIPLEVYDMANAIVAVSVKNNSNQPLADQNRRASIIDTTSGFECTFSWLGINDANAYAKAVGLQVALQTSDGGLDKLIASAGKVRARAA